MNERIHQKALLVLDGLTQLPPLPNAVRRALAMREGDRAEIDLVASLTNADRAATEEILRIANSSYFGIPRRVTGLKAAMELLGPAAFGNVALLRHAIHLFPPAEKAKVSLDRRAFWRHALMTAALAKHLAARSSSATLSPEQAFAAGLLHDVGKLALEVHAPDEYAPVIEKRRAEPATELWMHERLELGLTHAYVSATLLGRWEIDRKVRKAVEWHHAPARAEEDSASVADAALVHWCDVLAHRAFLVPNVPVPVAEPNAAALAGLSDDEAEPTERSRAELVGAEALFRDLFGE